MSQAVRWTTSNPRHGANPPSVSAPNSGGRRPRAPAGRLPALSTLLFAALSCARSPTPCQAPGDCDEGRECLASRCKPSGGIVVGEHSERRVVFPSRIVAENATTGDAALQLGGARGAQKVYIEFELGATLEGGPEMVEAAFLELTSPALAPLSDERVELEIGLLLDSPDPDGVAPRNALSKARVLMRPATRSRADVTEMVRTWVRAPERRHGFVVEPTGQSSLLLATGAEGAGPRLDIYWKRGSEP